MFGKNEVVGQKYFKDAGDKLLVTSIFYTLQGEGPFRGEPAVFIRLAKCNLACSFCDTYFDGGDWMTIQEILDKAIKVVAEFHDPKVVPLQDLVCVITGGEPMLQPNITNLVHMLYLCFGEVQIESNGTVFRELPEEITLVVSPKCQEKGGKPVRYLKPNKKVLERADCLKFVIEDNPGSPYHEIPEWALEFRNRNNRKIIFISPINVYNDEPRKSKELRMSNKEITLDDRSNIDEVISFWEPGLLNMEQNKKNHEYAARYCMKHGLILNLQLHLYASLA